MKCNVIHVPSLNEFDQKHDTRPTLGYIPTFKLGSSLKNKHSNDNRLKICIENQNFSFFFSFQKKPNFWQEKVFF